MIIALPLTDTDEFSPHFGAAAKARLYEVAADSTAITHTTTVVPPEPEPCGWAAWLATQGVTHFLAGGMGQGAQQRMAEAGILVTVGVAAAAPDALARAFLDGSLVAGANACEDGHHGHGHGHHDEHEHHHDHGCSCGSH